MPSRFYLFFKFRAAISGFVRFLFIFCTLAADENSVRNTAKQGIHP
jgi:hypothetical protein